MVQFQINIIKHLFLQETWDQNQKQQQNKVSARLRPSVRTRDEDEEVNSGFNLRALTVEKYCKPTPCSIFIILCTSEKSLNSDPFVRIVKKVRTLEFLSHEPLDVLWRPQPPRFYFLFFLKKRLSEMNTQHRRQYKWPLLVFKYIYCENYCWSQTFAEGLMSSSQFCAQHTQDVAFRENARVCASTGQIWGVRIMMS